MDVIFEPHKGEESFAIEVGFFDSVLEIKEKIEKYKRIPIPKQTLIFNGRTLQDDHDVEFCQILHLSRIKLIVAAADDDSDNNKIHLIHEIDAVGPLHRIVLQSNAGELQDQRSLRECDLADNSEVEVRLRQSPTGSAAASGTTTATGRNKLLKVMVQPKIGETKIAMEVNPAENVGQLKKELQKLQPRMQFHLPAEGFFFIYDQDVMDEDRSFRWHGVANGDTIEIFNGRVTGGS